MLQPFCFLGIQVHPLTMDNLHNLIKNAVEKNKQYVIGHHNLHSLYIHHHDQKMSGFYRMADFIHVDGMPLIFLGRLFNYPLFRIHRVTYADWVHLLMQQAAQQGWRMFFLGSKPGVAHKAANFLKKEIPGLQLETMHGYFDMTRDCADNQRVLEKIKSYKPDVLMVGMGMPRQEYWVLENQKCLRANVVLTSGACMDYVAKIISTPPRWMGQMGLEWLYRLICEPKRLWRRYLVEPWFVLKLIIKEFI